MSQELLDIHNFIAELSPWQVKLSDIRQMMM